MHIVLVTLMWLLPAVPSWAVLGGSVRSVEADRLRLHGALISVPRQGYSIHQINSPSGHVIKEYTRPDGIVFGVSWQGPTVPNLQQLLGAYFVELQQAQSATRRRRGSLLVQKNEVVIESAGHQRAFYGRAYIPKLLPDGVSQAVVQ